MLERSGSPLMADSTNTENQERLAVWYGRSGMLRDMAFAHFFGAGWLMTAWTMGFKMPNLAR